MSRAAVTLTGAERIGFRLSLTRFGGASYVLFLEQAYYITGGCGVNLQV